MGPKGLSMLDLEEEPDQEKRIQRLRSELEKLGGEIPPQTELSGDLEEQFLKHVLEFETARPQPLLKWLENAGLQIPPPELLDDTYLEAKLWEVIERMASLGAYLHNTNHLSNRELYTFLFAEALREDAVLFPEDPSYAYHIDPVGSGSDEDIGLYLKYFAADDERQRWANEFPDFAMPAREVPPASRDSLLPAPPFG